MSRVIVGVDPHKKSATIEVVDDHATVLATGRFGADTTGYRLMLGYVGRQWPHHGGGVVGAKGVGRPRAQRLLADGETVVDVPAKLAARVRVFDTGNARKTDATDAHAVAMVAVRTPRLNQLAYDEELIALRLLTDRRDELSHLRVQTVNRLQRLLTELVPGGAKRDLSALQANRLLASVRPRTLRSEWQPCLSCAVATTTPRGAYSLSLPAIPIRPRSPRLSANVMTTFPSGLIGT